MKPEKSIGVGTLRLALAIAISVSLVACKPSAARRAAAKASASEKVKQSGAAARSAGDITLRRWTISGCGAARSCPLPRRQAESFVGGSYNQVRLGRDTTFYRVYSSPDRKFGASGERYSYWSRSDARGRRAIIDSAIPTSRNGNTATNQVAIRPPRGTVVYEGRAREIRRGTIGGGNQIVVDRVKPGWLIR